MGQGGESFLIIGDLAAKTGVVSFKPAKGNGESRWGGCDCKPKGVSTSLNLHQHRRFFHCRKEPLP